MKFLVVTTVVKSSIYTDDTSEECRLFDRHDEAEEYAKSELGRKETFHAISYSRTTMVTKAVVYPVRDGVEYRNSVSKVVSFNESTEHVRGR